MINTFKRSVVFGLAAIAGAAMLPTAAQSAVLTCTASAPGGCSMFSAAPPSVGSNAPTTTGIQWFSGKIVTLASAFTVGGVTFSAGSKVISDYFIFNPNARGNVDTVGSATFGGTVRAVIGGRSAINSLSSLFAPTGTTINLAGGNDLEGNDSVTISGTNSVEFDLRASRGNQDTFLVLTAVPEPETWMMLIFGFGLIGYSMRRRPNSVLKIV